MRKIVLTLATIIVVGAMTYGVTQLLIKGVEVVDEQPAAADFSKDYGQLAVGNYQAAPQILNLSLHRHGDTTYGLEVEVSNHIFDQANFGGTPRDNFGHGRVIVDGQAVGWLQGFEYRIDDLSDGRHTVGVELLANNHQALMIDNKAVFAEIEITTPSEDFVQLLDDGTLEQRSRDKHVH